MTDLQDDRDFDGFRNTCEHRLAEFFRPYLLYSANDVTTEHEPYWASDFQSGMARLFWAFAYYEDDGADGTGCDYDPEPFYSCDGHYGDSEWLLLQIEYNATTQHWELFTGELSQHYGSARHVYGLFDYQGPHRGYPTIYVASGKHANYESDAACDGGAAGYDECYSNDPQRDFFSAYRNLGSFDGMLLNCVESEGLYASSGREECFWARSGEFRGWTGINNPEDVTPYGTHLTAKGF